MAHHHPVWANPGPCTCPHPTPPPRVCAFLALPHLGSGQVLICKGPGFPHLLPWI